MSKEVSVVRSTIDPRHVGSLVNGQDYALDSIEADLAQFGIGGMDQFFGMDAIQGDLTSPNIGVAVQFAQQWLPGWVRVTTAPHKIDDLIGISTVGSWEQEEIVQGMLENTGVAVPYNDLNNISFANYNQNYVTRTIVRFETGMQVTRLEASRAALMNVSSDGEKRIGCSMSLNTARNQVGFYGYNNGANNTYGFLNDPQLPAYNTVATGAVSGSPLWSVKTWQEIVTDLLTGYQTLRTQSKGRIDPKKTPITLAVPTDRRDYLSKTNEFGITVMDWIKTNYPLTRVEDAPQLDNANGGANVFYMFAESVDDSSTDDRRTFIQAVPAIFQVLGVAQEVKGYKEGHTNATAGAMCKRPYAVYRATGI